MTGTQAWQRLREHRIAAATLLVLLAAIILWLPYQFEPSWYPLAARLLHLGLPSLAVFAAFVLAAWVPSVDGKLALAMGAFVYLAVAMVLALAGVAYVGVGIRRASGMLALFIWPTLVLVQVGRWVGWVPLPE